MSVKIDAFVVAGISLVSFCAGGGLAYHLAIKKLNAEYNDKMEAEIEKTKEHFRKVYKADEFSTPAEAAEAVGLEVSLEEAAQVVRNYGGEEVGTEFEEQVERHNVFEDGDQLVLDKAERDLSKPYVIDIQEFMDAPDGYDQIQLTYYAGDNTLGDDKDEPIPDNDLTVGQPNLEKFGVSDPDQPHILLVRNDQLKMDFEISHSDDKFAHVVLGFKHSDETFERRRSSRPRREE